MKKVLDNLLKHFKLLDVFKISANIIMRNHDMNGDELYDF